MAIKRYLYSHVRSNFLRINVDEMALAVYLPVQQISKKQFNKVFAQFQWIEQNLTEWCICKK